MEGNDEDNKQKPKANLTIATSQSNAQVEAYRKSEEVHFICCDTDREMYDSTMRAINQNKIENLYIHNKQLTRVVQWEDKFGKAAHLEEVDKYMLSTMLMHSLPVTRNKGGNQTSEIPKPAVMDQVLGNDFTKFLDVNVIEEMVHIPLLLPNMTFMSEPGYDKNSNTFYAPINKTPYKIYQQEVKDAKRFIMDEVLGDFPWVSNADKTNTLAYFVTQVIKGAFNHLIPLAFITSPQAGSGKTLIADLNLEIFGGVRKSMPSQEEELRKTIFSALRGSKGTIIFDNIDTGTTLKSSYLAEILTSFRHTDRQLGQSKDITVTNGRVWMATGNNLSIGGDLATRIVPIRIDPDMPNPEKRKNFKLNLLNITSATKQDIYNALVTLIQDWINKGAKEKQTQMRGFTPWATTIMGFMDHHEIPNFLGNVEEVISDVDEERNFHETLLFLIHNHFQDNWFSTTELRNLALGDVQQTPNGIKINFPDLTLKDYLPQDRDGSLSNVQTLGRFLGKIKNTHFGSYKLESQKSRATKQTTYRIIKNELIDPS